MNGAHFHLIVNHLPIIFPIVSLLVLALGMITKSTHVKRTAFFILIIGAITAAIAMISGEGAEETVEHMKGISESYIETHEYIAKIFTILSFILGGMSLAGLWISFKHKLLLNMACIGIFVMNLVVLMYAKQTGTTGGEIRHTEIREGNTPTNHIDHDKDE